MSALQVMIDGVFTAAELFVLLFVSPVAAAEGPRTDAAAHRPAFAAAREAHLLSSSLDVRLVGSLADVRVSQHFRNDNAQPVNLATRLPPSTSTQMYCASTVRAQRDLLQLESRCGGDGEEA